MMAAAAGGCAGSGQARSPGTSATGSQPSVVWLASVQMTSATTGWALRFTGYPGSRLPVGLLPVRATDGARRWYDVAPLPAGSTPVVLDAVTASRAWLAVTVRSLTFVLSTGNGGVTWAKSGPVGLGGPAALSFSDTVDGWLLQSLGAATGSEWVALYRSVDSGLRWSLVAQTPPPPTYGTSRGGLPTGCDKPGVPWLVNISQPQA